MSTTTTTRRKGKGRFQLAKIIGTRYRFDLEESWYEERFEVRDPDRLWYETIPCAKGAFIGVYSVKPLIFKLWTERVKNAKTVAAALDGQPGFIRADFAFEGEAEIYFDKTALPTVAEQAGARKKRQLTPEQKAELVNRGAAHRFLGMKHGAQAPSGG